MDSVDKQFSKLNLLSGRSHSPLLYTSCTTSASGSAVTSGGKVATLANNFKQHPYITIPKTSQDVVEDDPCKISGSTSPKKVAPIVPPKPQKQIKLPEVPQSILVKQAREPLYSKRLQSNCVRGINTLDEYQSNSIPKLNSCLVSRQPILNRNQSAFPVENNLYSKLNKITLDNPAVLEQQLEALAHHKMQLEKKGLLHQQQKSPMSFGSTLKNTCIPKLSSSSLVTDLKNSGSNFSLKSGNLVSAPLRAQTTSNDANIDTESSNVYSNVMLNGQPHFNNKHNLSSSSVYHNVHYDTESCLENLPVSPPSAVLTISTLESSQYLKDQNDEAIPPPPSPVSSSYSELRRATDIFSKIPAPVPIQQKFHDPLICSVGDQDVHYAPYIENYANAKSVSSGSCMGAQQNYMNMNFNNDYTSFTDSTSSQSINQGSSDYYGYGSFSQGSSTYESIYEPINPRPPSQLSSRSNYLMYVNGPQATDGAIGSNGSLSSLTGVGNSDNTSLAQSSGNTLYEKHRSPKEAEVEALTDFLVHSMDGANDVDSYGACVKCHERVVGENSGCTAMDQIYHIACFTCSQCQINLQGKPFYALESKPYCEYDYLQTLEKCSVCMKPILERILRATGKPYHPQCFTCVVCGNSLDGIPFTVDATNQNYCIADFHKKFAPRCCVCKQPIMPEPGQEETVRVVALDRSFHFECYKCEDCGLLLSSESEGRGCYPLDDHVLCKSCNAKRVQMLTNRMTTEL